MYQKIFLGVTFGTRCILKKNKKVLYLVAYKIKAKDLKRLNISHYEVKEKSIIKTRDFAAVIFTHRLLINILYFSKTDCI